MIVAKIGLTKPWEIKRDYSIYSNLSNGCNGFTFHEYGFVKICVLVEGLGNTEGQFIRNNVCPLVCRPDFLPQKAAKNLGEWRTAISFFGDRAFSMTFA